MKELPKAYEPKQYEDKIYKQWEDSGLFNPDVCVEKGVTSANAQPFSVVLPPPNVTGTLHMGHAAMLAIEDVMIRYHRMKGDRTLWVPGTDHAAIATQSKVEKILFEKEGKTRHDLGRAAFLKQVEQFAQDSHDTIVNQAKKMGASLDWSREAYTLDEKRNRAVRTVFKQMYDEGLIYRGNRIVNWDPQMQSNVSDIEVDRKEEKAPFYYFQYGPFVIGTARPETKFGDKYVVINPHDERYQDYQHGQKIEMEWINGPITATVIKDEASDMAFGTGVMTITPWHDLVDFEIAERHNLDREQIIDLNGKLLPIAQEFAGMPILEARKKIVEKLKQKGLLVKIDEEYVHNIAVNSRGGGMIEPQIMKQWFVNVDKKFAFKSDVFKSTGLKKGDMVSLKQVMRHVVEKNHIDILPDRFGATYFEWVDNLRDWCISRQIWFGHQVPVWYAEAEQPTKMLYLVHCNTLENEQGRMSGHSNPPLSETGGQQALEQKERFKDVHVDVVVCSDLDRATDTARIIFGDHDVDIIYDARLRECNYGDLNGALKSEAPHGQAHYIDQRYPNGESYREVEARVAECLAELQTRFPGKTIAIVGHCGPQLAMQVLTQGKSWQQAFAEDWRPQGAWQPSWEYDLTRLTFCGEAAPRGDQWKQDADTLDTWFSAGIWTFSTLGWPEETADLRTYHPTSVLETGYDILFFWVVRMILMTTYAVGDIPFKTVYLHGLVRDEQGKKMSKSSGNIIDPLDMIEKFGTDATRLSLLIGSTPGNDVKLSEEKIAGFRNFTNKLWNICRFALLNIDTLNKDIGQPIPLDIHDKRILSQFDQLNLAYKAGMDEMQFSHVGESLRSFTWGDFADDYLESTKDISGKAPMLNYILNNLLKMWHPFMPFVTETIWQEMYGSNSYLMVESIPLPKPKADAFTYFAEGQTYEILIKNTLLHLSSFRDGKGLVGKKVEVVIRSVEPIIKECLKFIQRKGNLSSLEIIGQNDSAPEGWVEIVLAGNNKAYMNLQGLFDVGAERARLEKEIASVSPYVDSLSVRLAGDFAKNAPPAIVEKERQKLAEAQEKLAQLQNQLSSLAN